SFSSQEAFHGQFHGAELLVAPDDFDGLALVVGGEQCEGADDVEQVVAVKHPGHEALLVVGAAAGVLQVIQRTRKRVGPAVEILLAVGGDGAEFRFLPTGGNNELVEIKERRTAFALSPALLAVTEELADSFRDRFLHLRRFAFDDDDWQTVEEQDDVGNNVMLCTEDAYLELTDGDKAVVVPV